MNVGFESQNRHYTFLVHALNLSLSTLLADKENIQNHEGVEKQIAFPLVGGIFIGLFSSRQALFGTDRSW